MEKSSTPKFSLFLVLFTGLLIYSFLNTVIFTFSIFRVLPQVLIEQNPKGFKELVELHEKARKEYGEIPKEIEEKINAHFENFFDIKSRMSKAKNFSINSINHLLILGLFVSIIWFHLPIYKFFRWKRRGNEIPKELHELAKKRIVYSSLFLGVIPATFILTTIVFNGVALYFELSSSNLKKIILSGMTLEIFSAILTGVLIFSWQKYRVQNFYLAHVFPPEDLRNKLPVLRDLSLRSRLWVLISITTFFPLFLVLLFVFPSISFIKEPLKLYDPQLELLFGTYIDTIDKVGMKETAFQWLRGKEGLQNLPGIVFVNIIDTVILILGLFVGILISLVYSFALIRFATANIVKPIYELQNKMKDTHLSGNYQNYATVKSNDEIGELGEVFNKMLHGLEEKEKVKSLFGQYLTREVSEEILNGRVKLGGDKFEATIIFSDIRNFTSMSEKMAPEEVLSFLNSYMEYMIDVIVEHGGIIDKFMGDGILATFGVPVRNDNHAEKALLAAKAMQAALSKLNEERKIENLSEIKIGIGIHTGIVIAGNIGNKHKTEYTVIGDTVNLASRIEGLTKSYNSSILISDSTYKQLPDKLKQELTLNELPNSSVRGKKETVNLYEVM